MAGQTPLAWCNLTHDRVRFLLFVLGIVFAVVLIFIQLGFRGALLDSNTLIHEKLNADFVLVSPNRAALAMRETISRRRLSQAESVPGVASVHALFIDNALGVLRNTHAEAKNRQPSQAVRIIGVDPNAHLLALPELDPGDPRFKGRELNVPGTALYDRYTKKSIAEKSWPDDSVVGPLKPGTITELSGQQIELIGGYELGSDFTAEGSLIVSTETFSEVLRRPYAFGAPLADVDFGLVRLKRGADKETVRKAIQEALKVDGESDVDVLDPGELAEREKNFWLSNTPIGFAFGFGMFMGFAVGTVICYQILSGDVADHLPEYATLKAVGYGNFYLAKVVIQEALILAVAGFLVGFGISWLAYLGLTEYTGMPLRMTFDRAFSVFLTTVAMCVISALIALVRLLRADPADVF